MARSKPIEKRDVDIDTVIDDVLELAEPVLKHRMALTFAARAEGRNVVDIIHELKARIG